MKPNIALYLSNWPAYFEAKAQAKVDFCYSVLPLKRKLLFKLIWLDVFVNMITGGDPRETISSSIHKDRKSSWGAGFLINIIEVIDDDHGETSVNWAIGEGSPYDREIHSPLRVVLGVIWAFLFILAIDVFGGWAWRLLLLVI